MKLAGLQERIAKWEDLHTDFKERFDSNRELAKDIVCFANTDGGQLIFGISSNKHIVGVDRLAAIQKPKLRHPLRV